MAQILSIEQLRARPCAVCGEPCGRATKQAKYCLRCSMLKSYESSRKSVTSYKTLARNYVAAAIRCGDLPRLDGSIPCKDCGKPAVQYEHRDYKRPLDVDPVCRSCNQRRGPGANWGLPKDAAPRERVMRQDVFGAPPSKQEAA